MSHIHEFIDFTAEVYIVYKNHVLLRMHDKYKFWLGIGGHIRLNEDPNQTILREAKEGLGLDITLDDRQQQYWQNNDGEKELIPPYFLNRHKVSENHEHINFVYFATAKTNLILQNKKLSDCRWFTKEEIKRNTELLPSVKHYALKALECLAE